MPKVESAKLAIEALNPDVEVITYQTRLDKENILGIFSGYDIILDGTDNFSTRYLINDACVLLGKPNVHGSIFRFEGQATVFNPPDGPCYRCIFPDPPPPDLAPNCAEGGVLGVLPGVIGIVLRWTVDRTRHGVLPAPRLSAAPSPSRCSSQAARKAWRARVRSDSAASSVICNVREISGTVSSSPKRSSRTLA